MFDPMFVFDAMLGKRKEEGEEGGGEGHAKEIEPSRRGEEKKQKR